MKEQDKKQAAPEVDDPVQAVMQNLKDAGLGSLAWMGTAWVEAISDLSSEAVSFVADRVREDVKTQHEVLHCKSLSELQKVQAAFMERAINQYTVETGKLVNMSTDLFAIKPTKTTGTPL